MSSVESRGSMPEAFVWIDQDLCSGCGECSKTTRSIFKLENGVGTVHLDGETSQNDGLNGRIVNGNEVAEAKSAAEKCPGEVIFVVDI